MRQLVDIELMSEVGIQLAPLAVPGLRADALVCEGAGVAPKAVCAPHHQPLFHIQPMDRFHVYLVGFQLQLQHGVQTGSPIECGVAARRFGSQSYGMPLAEVSLPIGVDVDRASLARLLDDWTISRYEEQPDWIVFYLWAWRPGIALQLSLHATLFMPGPHPRRYRTTTTPT